MHSAHLDSTSASATRSRRFPARVQSRPIERYVSQLLCHPYASTNVAMRIATRRSGRHNKSPGRAPDGRMKAGTRKIYGEFRNDARGMKRADESIARFFCIDRSEPERYPRPCGPTSSSQTRVERRRATATDAREAPGIA